MEHPNEASAPESLTAELHRHFMKENILPLADAHGVTPEVYLAHVKALFRDEQPPELPAPDPVKMAAYEAAFAAKRQPGAVYRIAPAD